MCYKLVRLFDVNVLPLTPSFETSAFAAATWRAVMTKSGIAWRVAISAFLTSAAVAVSAQTIPADHGYQPVYLANFGNGSLDNSIDDLGSGPVKPGNTEQDGINATWAAGNGAIILGVTRPSSVPAGIAVASGLFVTPVNFGTGTTFVARATFRAPTGPQQTSNQFAAVVTARTGNERDLPGEVRVAASLQVRGTTARLNAVGAIPMAGLPNVPQAVYDAILNPENPQPFTLELKLDRKSGVGTATLKVGDYYSLSHNFVSVFTANSGPAVGAVGATLAIANGSDHRATVEVMDLRILQPQTDEKSSVTSCDPAWAEFGCRQPPSQ